MTSRPSPPGALLLKLARLLFDESVLARVVYPTIADLQEEVREAGTSRRRRLLARWRGYRAFWALVVVAPVAFWSWPVTPHTDRRALLNASGLVAGTLVIVGLFMMAPVGFWSWEVPAGIVRALGDARMVAFIAGPAALLLLAALRWSRGPTRFAVRTAEATLFSLLSVTAAVVAATAAFMHVFLGIARTGSPGLGVIIEAGVSSLQSLVHASLTLAACLLVTALLTIRVGRTRDAVSEMPSARMPARLAVALSAVLWLTIAAVGLLLHIHHGTLEMTLSMFDPQGPQPIAPSLRLLAGSGGSIGEVSALFADNLGLLFIGGGLLTLFVIAAGVTTWRMSRARTPHPILTWTSRIGLVAVLAGAVWHGLLLQAGIESYQDLLAGYQQQAVTPRPPVHDIGSGEGEGPSSIAMGN